MPWQTVSAVPELASRTVQVWWASPADAAQWQRALLSDVELTRLAGLRQQADQDRFLVACSVLRIVAGAHLGLAPAAVRIDRSCTDCAKPHGKPSVLDSGDLGELQVSVSHSGDRVAIAVTSGAAVGVDVEQVRPSIDPEALAGTVFSDAERVESAGRLTVDRFLAYWVCKEAVLKSTGDGLRLPLSSVVIADPAGAPRLVAWPQRPELVKQARLYRLDAGAGHLAALTVLDPAGRQPVELSAATLLAGQPEHGAIAH